MTLEHPATVDFEYKCPHVNPPVSPLPWLVYVLDRKGWVRASIPNNGATLGGLNGVKYPVGGFVYVANEATLEWASSSQEVSKCLNKLWVAYVLDIRAFDPRQVFALVTWMYSPEELPKGTLDGNGRVKGRQPHHGNRELIASNHLDIINVQSVVGCADVQQRLITEGEPGGHNPWWRQAFNCLTGKLHEGDLNTIEEV
ncbi:hypothetical protein NLG97_g7723 [Lecanicillium saksenae]|uniref:Uncharacterized protein n=1 Tax=Lecanicillium saksenae TaxID=468837 RepID=A0ACC1QL00_9HYPO|nr:hypothetical protein NLG97_g7723 [Lecanicillium saksenae]